MVFKEAYEAEAELGGLLKQQLEAALTEKLGDGGVKITVESGVLLSPEEPGGPATWRAAYETAKGRTASLQEQLQKARGIGAAPAPAPAPALASGTAEPASAVARPPAAGASGGAAGDFNVGPFEFIDADKRDPQGFQKLEDLAQNTVDDEAALRLIAVPILGRRRPEDSLTSLPSLARVREVIGTDQFAVAEAVEFERIYVLKGAVARGLRPSDALEAVRQRMVDGGYGEGTEVFLQRAKDEGKSVLFVMLKEDLPKSDFAWWQWVLCILLLVATLISVNITTFSVATMTQQQMNSMDIDQAVKIAGKTIPTAVAIFTSVAAQEVARRAAAAKYGVDLTPPFFIPVWPFPSVGCFGAISRRLGTVPNEEASVAMSTAAGLAGFIVSLSILLYGLTLGPDPDKIVNLNFQLLPLILKVVLRPLLGQSSVSDQPDPFADPVSIAFPANAVEIGGIIGLIITALNLLPIGRLDGGIIIKSIFGGRTGGLLGFAGLFLLLLGSIAPNEAGLLSITFGFYTIIFQSGSENPPRDSVTELNTSLKLLGGLLVLVGTLLSIPGVFLPNL